MLLKKIFYGYTRVRYVMIQKNETDTEVSFTFCRWRPLGPKPGEYSWEQYYSNEYVRQNPYKTLERINRVTKARNWWGYYGSWHVTFYAPEIKAVLFSYVARNFWFWYLICIILWRVLYGK